MTDPSRLDRLISYLSPSRGAYRLAARRQMAMLSYEGARQSRRESSWITGATSANAEISMDRLALRSRVRSLLRDNPYAVKAVSTLVSNRVGTGILSSADGKNTRVNERVDVAWEFFVDHCDLYGRTDYYGILALAERTRIESGEALIRLVMVDAIDDLDSQLRLQVLEPDYIDTSRNVRLESGNEVHEGIEYSPSGIPAAYWLYDNHPGENSFLMPMRQQSRRFPANEILHYFRVLRPGQLSGVSELAPVIRRLWDLDGYGDAELMRKKIAACSVGFVTTPAGLPASSIGPLAVDATGRQTESFAPGMYHYGKPGESISFFDPKPSEGYREFFGVELHAIAAGLGIPYELLTGDLSEVTYTSHRGGLVQFRAMVEADQWQLVIPQLCKPIWDRFIRDSEMTPNLTVPVKFTPPRFGLLDPSKEIPAQVEAIQGGLRSWQETIRREGYDPKKVLDELEEDQEEFDRRGLKLTSDGRNSIKEPPPAAPAPTPDAPTNATDQEQKAA